MEYDFSDGNTHRPTHNPSAPNFATFFPVFIYSKKLIKPYRRRLNRFIDSLREHYRLDHSHSADLVFTEVKSMVHVDYVSMKMT